MNNESSEFLKLKSLSDSTVYITCTLSIIGSFLIIFTYVAFHDLRNRVRLILFHLSIMDLGIAVANMFGTAYNFDEYYATKNGSTIEFLTPKPSIDALCKAQGFVAMYSTYGSVFWTNCLAVYFYIAVAYHDSKKNRYVFWGSCVFCYFMPLGLTLWLLLTDRLGHTPYGSGGWCAIVNVDPKTGVKNYFSMSFGYDVWIYLTFILVPALYIGSRVHLSLAIHRSSQYVHPNIVWSAVQNIDYKFLLIPLTFILLRIWTCIVNISSSYSNIMHYLMLADSGKYGFVMIIIYYLSIIGDSGQGAVNGLIFVILTKKARKKLLQLCRNEEPEPPELAVNAKKIPKDFSSITPPQTPTPIPSDV